MPARFGVLPRPPRPAGVGKALAFAAAFLLVDFAAFGLVYALSAVALRGFAPHEALSSALLYMAFRVIGLAIPLQFALIAAIRFAGYQRSYPLVALADVGAFFAVTSVSYSGPATSLLLGMFSFDASHVPGPGIALVGSSLLAWVVTVLGPARLG